VNRRTVQQLAHDAIERGEPLAWFEELYASAADEAAIPWADLEPNPNLVDWLETHGAPEGRALVVGCGLGDDAELLAGRGLDVTGFDVAPSAIAWCRRRFPASRVDYRVANLFELPAEWKGAFDFVFEAFTVQALPPGLQAAAAAAIVATVAPGGRALVIQRRRDEDEPRSGPPWPPSRDELTGLFEPPLERVELDDCVDPHDESAPRVRLTLRRA
jgi:SAM-dependent methyltransferase